MTFQKIPPHEHRTEIIKIRVNPAELKILKKAKKRHQMARWCRENLLFLANPTGKKPDDVVQPNLATAVDPEFIREIVSLSKSLSSVANNTNQVATAVNTIAKLGIGGLSGFDKVKLLAELMTIDRNTAYARTILEQLKSEYFTDASKVP